MINYIENIYLNQYRDLNLLYEEYVGEELLSPIITFDELKTCSSIQIIYLRYHVDYMTPKK